MSRPALLLTSALLITLLGACSLLPAEEEPEAPAGLLEVDRNRFDARLMLTGEAPGAREDELGRPFCGRSGDFLDALFHQIDYQRADGYITSTVKCRPPDNRNPLPEELDTCQDLWLNQQTELVDPDIVLLLGRIAVGQVLGEESPLRDLHGQVREAGGRR